MKRIILMLTIVAMLVVAMSVVAMSVVASSSFAVNTEIERRLLGFGILALTLIVALLMAWRRPMRRNAGDPQAWGTPQEYHKNVSAPETAQRPQGELSSTVSGAPPEEAKPEPSVRSSGISNSSPASKSDDAVVPVSGAKAVASAHIQERLGHEGPNGSVRHLGKIRPRRSSSS
jgi:hypothetical protein